MSEVARICNIIIFHLNKLWKAKFSILCDVIFLVRLQGNFDIDHSGVKRLIRTWRSSSGEVITTESPLRCDRVHVYFLFCTIGSTRSAQRRRQQRLTTKWGSKISFHLRKRKAKFSILCEVVSCEAPAGNLKLITLRSERVRRSRRSNPREKQYFHAAVYQTPCWTPLPPQHFFRARPISRAVKIREASEYPVFIDAKRLLRRLTCVLVVASPPSTV